MTTIRVTNNQQPQTPLFSPLQNNIRPYSMTRSNTQRALMQPDEVLRLGNDRCIVLLRGQYPMLLYKITPPEFTDYGKLRPASIHDYPPDRPDGADGTADTSHPKTGDGPKAGSPEAGSAVPPPIRRMICPIIRHLSQQTTRSTNTNRNWIGTTN